MAKHSSYISSVLLIVEEANCKELNINRLEKPYSGEYAWCELVCNEQCVIRFGYDYYMYVNGIDILGNDELKLQIEALGLFVD